MVKITLLLALCLSYSTAYAQKVYALPRQECDNLLDQRDEDIYGIYRISGCYDQWCRYERNWLYADIDHLNATWQNGRCWIYPLPPVKFPVVPPYDNGPGDWVY